MKLKRLRAVIPAALLLITGCECNGTYTEKFKYLPGDVTYHRTSGSKILIVDTIRDWDLEKEILKYRGIDSKEEEHRYYEVELSTEK